MADGVRNLDKALATISEPWQPHRLTSINDYDVKVVKLQGEFVWHTHPRHRRAVPSYQRRAGHPATRRRPTVAARRCLRRPAWR
jgi:hypothetical protein